MIKMEITFFSVNEAAEFWAKHRKPDSPKYVHAYETAAPLEVVPPVVATPPAAPVVEDKKPRKARVKEEAPAPAPEPSPQPETTNSLMAAPTAEAVAAQVEAAVPPAPPEEIVGQANYDLIREKVGLLAAKDGTAVPKILAKMGLKNFKEIKDHTLPENKGRQLEAIIELNLALGL